MSNNNINSNAYRALHKFSLNPHLEASPEQSGNSAALPNAQPIKRFLTHQPITTGNLDSVAPATPSNANGNSVVSPFGSWQSDRIELKREPAAEGKSAEKRATNILNNWHSENPHATGEDLKALLTRRLGAKFITDRE